ncbi:MAG: hypothetical protein WC851_04290 [Candidatus Shapirobacteria bacterium]|jgi:hypothetical protein
MIDIKPGEIYLVQQHDYHDGSSLGAYVCVADICLETTNSPEHAVLTAIDEKGNRGHSVRFFPPHYDHGKIPIVRAMPTDSPEFIESVAKITW